MTRQIEDVGEDENRPPVRRRREPLVPPAPPPIPDQAVSTRVDTRPPRDSATPSAPVALSLIAPNPANTRDRDPDSPKIRDLVDSIRENGQAEACTVVTRAAFVAIFPEYADAVGNVDYVQVTGGRRYLALEILGRPMRIMVDDAFAASRLKFVKTMTVENVDREDFDPIEESRAVDRVVQEAGGRSAAARELGKTPAWVTQRMNLLEISPDAVEIIRANGVPLRDLRKLHSYPADQHITEVRKIIRRRAGLDKANDTDPVQPQPAATEEPAAAAPDVKRLATAVRRLGSTPAEVFESLRLALPPDDFRVLTELARQHS